MCVTWGVTRRDASVTWKMDAAEGEQGVCHSALLSFVCRVGVGCLSCVTLVAVQRLSLLSLPCLQSLEPGPWSGSLIVTSIEDIEYT